MCTIWLNKLGVNFIVETPAKYFVNSRIFTILLRGVSFLLLSLKTYFGQV